MTDNETENMTAEDGAGEKVERSRLALLGSLAAAATTGDCAYDQQTYGTYSEPHWGLYSGGGDSERDRDDDNNNDNNDVGATPGGGPYD